MPGFHVIRCERKVSWKVLDVDECEDVRERVAYRERTICRRRNRHASLRYCAFYSSDETEKKMLAEKIRKIAGGTLRGRRAFRGA